ncbi:DNA gyrase subunit A [Mycoplasmopsis alligatoris]|uniref:DNA gyrase subunit A n=1 Tax=Mycoplasmopsis alligatoris A21JP2 TaxID=747682 RepID=D4XVN1_9BACT|nr:DNA gyrase subunit A [Mycoplasmopsis alligatoris]EFF41605.1 DNA gyrase, A subunit [Mycoplasmopsis alligatoris A21JP2]
MSDNKEKNKIDNEEQKVHLETNLEYEYEENNRMVFKKKAAPKVEVEEEEIPQEKEEYQVQSQLITDPINGLSPIKVDSEMKNSFLEYAMSVIVSRALPDARDGLKPVHRRILYDMLELGITHSSQHRKSARIVGDVLGKYHPHGDSSVYEAMVRLAQDFSMRYPLVDGHGNFGSIDGDQAAAMRYTEARMSKLAAEMLDGIKKDTVNFVDNYDASELEPVVLPSRFPNILVSGATGIAVGMATEIPPHNLTETINATIAFARNPEITTKELMEHIKGPDFPTGATILGVKGIYDAYETGKGKIPLRSQAKIEEFANGKSRIIITEIPYAVKKTTIIEKIVELHKDKTVEGIGELRDESNREGIRIVIDVKKGYNAHILLNKLYQKSYLQTNVNANLVALVHGEPKLLNLKQILSIYLDHQIEVVTRRLKFDLEKAQDKLHILDGLKIAVSNIDEVVQIIKTSANDAIAQERLAKRFNLSDRQTKAILDMNLRRLTGLNIEKMNLEIDELNKEISYLKGILESREALINLIIDELSEIRDRFGDERRTQIDEFTVSSISDEDLIPVNNIVITTSVKGYVKRMKLEDYNMQNRGGIGVSTMKTYDDDDISKILQTTTHTDLMLFTNLGRVYRIRAHQVPEGSKQSKGTPFINIIPSLNEKEGEKVVSLLSVDEYNDDHFLVTITEKGVIKKTALSEYESIRSNGKNAFRLKEDDHLVNAFIVTDENEILIASNGKNVVKFSSLDLRPLSRNSQGVRGIRLDENKKVIAASSDLDGEFILSIGTKGFGKLTHSDEFRLIKRGGKGVTAINADKAGDLIFAKFVNKNDEALIITSSGTTIRISISQLSVTSRATKGVKIINLRENDEIIAVEIVKTEEEMEDFIKAMTQEIQINPSDL